MNIIPTYKNKAKKTEVITDVISAGLVLLFLYTALSKLFDYETFRFVLKRSPLLDRFAAFIAVALPVAELVVAALLFIPATRLAGLYSALMLMILFTVYLLYMILYSTDLPCNCGGVLKRLSWKEHIGFNIIFILLSLWGIVLYNRNKNRRSSPPP